MAEGRAHPKIYAEDKKTDEHVGERLRALRLQRDLSQAELGEIAGVSFQQVQKWEKGLNRINAGRLYRLARALEVDVAYYFEGLEETENGTLPMEDKAVVNVAIDFSRIADIHARQAVSAVVRMFADRFPKAA